MELHQYTAEKEVTRGHCDQMACKSPTLVVPRLRSLSAMVHSLRKYIYKQNLVIKMLNKDSDSEVFDVNAADLFGPKDLKHCYGAMMKSEQISKKDIVKYLFTELLEVDTIIQTKGSARGHISSGLLIQFACMR